MVMPFMTEKPAHMHIDITDNSTLREVQEVFSNFYPYLRIEFFHKAHKKYESSDVLDMVDAGKTIGEIKHTHVSGLLEMQPWYKVSDVEREFHLRFGLEVQVLWKDEEVWRQTTGMDDLTLKELNELGRNSSDEFIEEDHEAGFEEGGDVPG
jgi:hypothetical protein